MSRFDYVQYDETAMNAQAEVKSCAQWMEGLLNKLESDRWREAALMKLEEVYMCAGKAIRDQQIVRNGSAPLQEGRSNS